MLRSIPEEALPDEQVCMAQYMIGQLLKRQFFVVVFFFLMVSFVVCGMFQELVQLHEVCNRQMQALQEQEGGKEYGKQSRHRIKDTISADTILANRAFCIRSCPKIKYSGNSGI